jgi:hypothetical protein
MKSIKSRRKKEPNYINDRDFNKLFDIYYKIRLKEFAMFSLSVFDHHININAINILFEIGDKWPNTKKECKRLIQAVQSLVRREISRKPDIAIRAQRYMYELENFITRNIRTKNVNFKLHKARVKTKTKKDITSYTMIEPPIFNTYHFIKKKKVEQITGKKINIKVMKLLIFLPVICSTFFFLIK